MVEVLEKAGASSPDGVKESAQRAISLLQKTSTQFAAGTSWAAMALSLSLPPQKEEPRVLSAVRSSEE